MRCNFTSYELFFAQKWSIVVQILHRYENIWKQNGKNDAINAYKIIKILISDNWYWYMLLPIVYGRLSYGQQKHFSQSLYNTSIYPLHPGHLSRQCIVSNSIFFTSIFRTTPLLCMVCCVSTPELSLLLCRFEVCIYT